MKTKFRTGASKWSAVVTFEETSNSSTSGVIKEYDFERTDVLGEFTNYHANASTGHLTAWEIHFNSNPGVEITDITVAHELGHVIGLNDLYIDTNRNKLMYFRSDSTATAPTALDLWGARVILGLHTSHTFSQYRIWGVSGATTYHVQYCSSCNGNKATHQACIYGTNGRCTVCGFLPMV